MNTYTTIKNERSIKIISVERFHTEGKHKGQYKGHESVPSLDGKTEIALRRVPSLPQFKALLKIHKATGYPAHYVNDLLVHDRIYIANWNPQSFIWVLREFGTHMYICGEDHSRQSVAYHIKTAKQEGQHDPHSFYVYHMGKIKQVSPEDAMEFFVTTLSRLRTEVE